jgi:hypothetical protein
MLSVSVDDRRALWALTERCLRSEAHRGVLVVKDALRRGARHIRVRSTRTMLVVDDDGARIDDTIADVENVLGNASVSALHRLEQERGTDLLVALATAQRATVVGMTRVLCVDGGHVDDAARSGVPLAATRRALQPLGRAGGPGPDAGRTPNRVMLWRSAEAARGERAELLAWLPAPRAHITINGRRLTGSLQGALPGQLHLGRGVMWASHFRITGGHGIVGIALDEGQTRFTTLTQGVWVAQELSRQEGLPLVGVWDDDDLSSRSAEAVARGRAALTRGGQRLVARLADDFVQLSGRQRRRIRAMLLADHLPRALSSMPLFDTEDGPFSTSLDDLRRQERIVVGRSSGDVIATDDVRAFLHRQPDLRVAEALPAPPMRLRFRLAGF